MTAVTELGYLTLGVSDLEAWKSFAANVLGLEVIDGGASDTCYLRMDYWHHRVTLVQDGSDDLKVTGLRVAGRHSDARVRGVPRVGDSRSGSPV